jgi:hypothetical protein
MTTWDTAKVGDPRSSLPEPDPETIVCEILDPWTEAYVCCRPENHDGQHVAVAALAGVVATWPGGHQ